MEVDFEELGKLLYPDGFSGAGNEDVQNYISYLASCGIDKLLREGSHLKDERTLILEETKDLVYKNYKTFIHTADCSQVIFKEFGNVESHLEELIDELPSLRCKVEEFLTTSRDLSQSRHTTSLTLSKHTQVLEILELPQLMDTCVRNGYYEDALEILSYVRRLEKKHLDIPVVASIVSDVKKGTRLMLLQLLLQLRSSLTLPQCLKTVGFLRRLNVFTDAELKLKFLQARDSWFSALIKAVPKDDVAQHVAKVVDLSRIHLFDIVTQYRAIFSDEDSRLGFSEVDVNEQAIFHGWIIHKVNQFIHILEKDLEKGVGSNLESLLDQCMFFGQSFSRIGADFRNLLIPIFQNAAFRRFESDVRSANVKFDESLNSFSLMESTSLHSSSLIIETQDKTSPPLSLMEFLPLAHYLNGLVSAFNGLRQCCPLALLKDVVSTLSSSVSKVVTNLKSLHQLEASGFTANEEKSFERMCCLVSTAVIPHINKCLRFLFPLQAIANISGISVTELQRKDVGQLDADALITPIENFIPKKAVTIVENSEIQNSNETHSNDNSIELNHTENIEVSDVNETVAELFTNPTELDKEDSRPNESIVQNETGEQVNDLNLIER
ncbi:Conserved oligomeric Golgi complex subunit 8 [Armadillidium vulgare]|nr:Conserved oligomeric Golgi complex subunit 8 [Armadillidium vulgare]